MATFTFLGLGMAFPYLLLSAFPELLRFIPKPGPWMVTFKEIMGFFMLATVDRKAFIRLPAPDGAFASIEVGGDLLP